MSSDELFDVADKVLRSVCIETLCSSAGEYSAVETYK